MVVPGRKNVLSFLGPTKLIQANRAKGGPLRRSCSWSTIKALPLRIFAKEVGSKNWFSLGYEPWSTWSVVGFPTSNATTTWLTRSYSGQILLQAPRRWPRSRRWSWRSPSPRWPGLIQTSETATKTTSSRSRTSSGRKASGTRWWTASIRYKSGIRTCDRNMKAEGLVLRYKALSCYFRCGWTKWKP